MGDNNTSEYKVRIATEGDASQIDAAAASVEELNAKVAASGEVAEQAGQQLDAMGAAAASGAETAQTAQAATTEGVKALASATGDAQAAQEGANAEVAKLDATPIARARDEMGGLASSTAQADAAVGQLQGSVSETGDALGAQVEATAASSESLADQAGTALSAASNAAQLGSSLENMADKAKAGAKETGELGKQFQEAGKGASIATHLVHGFEIVTGRAAFSIRGLRSAIHGITEALAENPFVIWATGITAATFAVYELIKSSVEAAKAAKANEQIIGESANKTVDHFKEIEDFPLSLAKQQAAVDALTSSLKAARSAADAVLESTRKLQDEEFAGQIDSIEKRRVQALRAAGPDQQKQRDINLDFDREKTALTNRHQEDLARRGLGDVNTKIQENFNDQKAATEALEQRRRDHAQANERLLKAQAPLIGQYIPDQQLAGYTGNRNSRSTYNAQLDQLTKSLEKLAPSEGKPLTDQQLEWRRSIQADIEKITAYNKETENVDKEEENFPKEIAALKSRLAEFESKGLSLQVDAQAGAQKVTNTQTENETRTIGLDAKGDQVSREDQAKALNDQKAETEAKLRDAQNTVAALKAASENNPLLGTKDQKEADNADEKKAALEQEAALKKQIIDLDLRIQELEGTATPGIRAAAEQEKRQADIAAGSETDALHRSVEDAAYEEFKARSSVTAALARAKKGPNAFNLHQTEEEKDAFFNGGGATSTGSSPSGGGGLSLSNKQLDAALGPSTGGSGGAVAQVTDAQRRATEAQDAAMVEVAKAFDAHGAATEKTFRALVDIIRKQASNQDADHAEIQQLKSQTGYQRK